MFGRIVLASVSVIAFSAAANAADMYVPAPAGFGGYMDAPYAASNWAGFYVGFHGGGGWGNTDFPVGSFALALTADLPQPPSQSSSGGVFGAHFGYNWQYGRFVG